MAEHRPGRRHRRRRRAGAGGSAARPGCVDVQPGRRRHRRPARASGSPSWARWPTRAAARAGVQRRRQLRRTTRCSCAGRWSTSRPSTASSPSTRRSRGSPRAPRCTRATCPRELGLAGWPAVAEESIIARDVLLAEHVGSRLHVCHVSTAGSVEIIRWAKARGRRRHRRGHPAPPAAHRRAASRGYDPVFKVNPPLRTARRRRGAARGARRRHDRRRRHRPRAARRRGQGLRVGGRGGRHDRAWRRRCPSSQATMVDTGLLDWAGVADRMSAAPARIGRARRAGPPARGRGARQPRARSTRRPAVASTRRAMATPEPQHALRGAGSCPARWWRRSCADAPPSATEPWRPGERSPSKLSASERSEAVLVLEDGRTLRGAALRRRRRHGRRGRLHHRDDRLPGDPDRPVLPPPGRRADGPAHRQHGRQRRRRRVPPDLGRRVRRARPGAPRLELAVPARARRRARRAGRRRDQRRRHPGDHPAPARARRDARRGVLGPGRRPRRGRPARRGARGAADGRGLPVPAT